MAQDVVRLLLLFHGRSGLLMSLNCFDKTLFHRLGKLVLVVVNTVVTLAIIIYVMFFWSACLKPLEGRLDMGLALLVLVVFPLLFCVLVLLEATKEFFQLSFWIFCGVGSLCFSL